MPINIVVPEMGESVVDARVSKWHKGEGDAVAVGETLVELETDKVDIEVSAPKAGVLAKIAHGNGDDVKIGDVLGTIDEGAEVRGADANGATVRSAEVRSADVAATPSARREARDQNVDIGSVKSEGPRVTKSDVKRAAQPDSAAPRTPAPTHPAPSSPAPRTPHAAPRPPLRAKRGAHPHVQAPRDDRAPARRGSADGRDVDDVQ